MTDKKKQPKRDKRGSKKGEFGQPPHRATEEQKKMVKTLAALGNRHDDISLVMGFSTDTLQKHYADELRLGVIEANSKVGEGMLKKAIGGDVDCMKYWLSRRAGWAEKSVHELTGANGGAIKTESSLTVQSDSDILKRWEEQRLAEMKQIKQVEITNDRPE